MNAQQLKNSILQMAVQGKLVPQDTNDEPASVLLERIRAEKEKLIKEGKIKKEKNPSYIFRGEDNLPYEKIGKNEPVCIADELPFEIPDTWVWARCSSIGIMIRGKGIKRGETVSSGKPCIRYGEIYTSYNTSFDKTLSFIPNTLYSTSNLIEHGDVVFTLTGENKPDIAKAIAYIGDEPVAAGGDLAYWTAHGMNPLYLSYYLNGPYCIEMKKRLATGDIIVHISTEKIGSFLIPIPPLKEQDRIVEQIKHIEPLINEYSKCDKSISVLSEKFPEMLKKSILQQAVMGKLVPQDPNDEPASVLLERIRAEKNALIKDGKLKKDKHESIIYRRDNSYYEVKSGVEKCIDEEIPFAIPDSWEWVRLSAVIDVRDGTHDTPKYVASGYPLITGKDFYSGVFDFSKTQFISKEDYEEIRKRSCVDIGDILFSMIGGNIGSMIKITEDNYFDMAIKNVALFKQYSAEVSLTDYLFCFLKSQVEKIQSIAQGGAQSFVSLKVLRSYLFPVPPLEEQHRIVACLDEMLLHCNSLAG